jgi:hypothetical protein
VTWTDDNLLGQIVHQGLREDKPATEIRRPVPQQKPIASARPRYQQNRLGRDEQKRRAPV